QPCALPIFGRPPDLTPGARNGAIALRRRVHATSVPLVPRPCDTLSSCWSHVLTDRRRRAHADAVVDPSRTLAVTWPTAKSSLFKTCSPQPLHRVADLADKFLEDVLEEDDADSARPVLHPGEVRT